MDEIVNALHESVAEANSGNEPKRCFKPKAYWCPELSQIRDKKRFWYKLWVSNGRPRSGVVFQCYKGVKKLFRRVSRDCANNLIRGRFSKFNSLYYSKNLNAFWQHVKRSRRHNVNSVLQSDNFASFYKGVMTDDGVLSDEQKGIASIVEQHLSNLSQNPYSECNVSSETVSQLIGRLSSNSAPGMDGVTGEHLKHGKCDLLCTTLSVLLSHCLSWQVTPSIFKVGVIVPILKKPSLNPNEPCNFRPVTLSSVFSKLLELIMLPDDDAYCTQFGFRKGRGTSLPCSLFNDVKCYFECKKSPLFTCSLDAERCFDSLWHHALFYKLIDKIPDHHWVLLYRWYRDLRATVRWNNCYSVHFKVTRGTRQGSLLSPQLFNIFINDLLKELGDCDDKVRIGDCSLNSFAYADDVNLLCTTAPGLQRLINICANYADKWRFKFGIRKTKCMIVSGESLSNEPVWQLNGDTIENVSSLDILGVTFNAKNDLHADNRTTKCRRSFHSLRNIGMSYPGCASDVKAYLWKSVCQPVLLYGFDSLHISPKVMKNLESTQSSLVKQCLGLSKRSRSTNLLQALHIPKIEERIKQSTASLMKRVFSVDSPAKDLSAYFLSLYITKGLLIPGTLVDRCVSHGLSPIRSAFCDYKKPLVTQGCGVVDSLRTVILHENFIKPYSDEHVLASLLTRAF